ncbi:MAG: adenylate/guanylate cyclase domain-containing protein [Chitinophagaceae bacterium]
MQAQNYSEENIAILMADLTGYTALTETHGAGGAADMIDNYLDIVNDSLVGDSYLHEQTGDEVMIVSASADHLLATAQKLMENTSSKNHFLQVHGGLHYGRILKRKNKFFGTTINLAARIAGKANPGTIWCSEDYVNALDHKPGSFKTKGRHYFKNISEANEVFELIPVAGKKFQVDPVCKMLINEKENAVPHPVQNDLFFCDHSSLAIYQRNQAN